ncbi:MAG: porin family protein [Bacteroidota bacterium]|nr:porin family protein [Bacteroidota bacterium]
MKNRLLSIVLILALSASFAIAQEPGKMSFGILGGVNFQNLNGKISSGDKLENDMLMGFHGGVNVQIPIAPEFYFQPGLMFAVKGAKNTKTILGSEITDEIKLNYIEVPLNLVYKGALGSGFVMLGFGPYVAYGISGKEVIAGNSFSYEKGVDYNAFDAGANIFVGYEMSSGIFLQLDTQFGMLDIDPNENNTAKNTGFGLSLGYRF